MSFLGGFCIPEVCVTPFPPVFVSIWMMITEALVKTRDFSKFAIGLPRGFGKTTVIKILIIYIILFTKKRFILIVGATATLAENILGDVANILDSPNMVETFGNWGDHRTKDTAADKRFRFCGKNIIIVAAGSGSAVRGLNIDNVRPDVIICDDMQTKQEALSDTVSRTLIDWFMGTLLKVKAPTGVTNIYVGNMYRDVKIGGSQSSIFTCILRNLTKNPDWKSWVVGGILSDGNSLWEEVQPKEQLLAELESDTLMGCADVFMSEVMNNPNCGTGEHFDLSRLKPYDLDPQIDILVGKFIMIDPSLGKKDSDAQVVGLFEVYDKVPVFKELRIIQKAAPELVKEVIRWAIKEDVPLVCSEAVAYQGSLLKWFEYMTGEEGPADCRVDTIEFKPVTPKGRKKNSRIINWFRNLMASLAVLHPNVLSQVLSQIMTFDPMSLKNIDDILDVGAYADDVILEYPQELMMRDILQIEDNDEEGVMEDNICF